MLISRQYVGNIIKEYKYWTLLLHERQNPYVGRCYAWWKDSTKDEGNGFPLSDIPPDAILECFKTIASEVRVACAELGYPVWECGNEFLLNQAYLCNEVTHHKAHLHVHFIPRHARAIYFKPLGRCIDDELWGKHYGPMNIQYTLAPAEHRAVLQTMRNALNVT